MQAHRVAGTSALFSLDSRFRPSPETPLLLSSNSAQYGFVADIFWFLLKKTKGEKWCIFLSWEEYGTRIGIWIRISNSPSVRTILQYKWHMLYVEDQRTSRLVVTSQFHKKPCWDHICLRYLVLLCLAQSNMLQRLKSGEHVETITAIKLINTDRQAYKLFK